jgi:Glycosyltransferases involved in cell wall biogenesis
MSKMLRQTKPHAPVAVLSLVIPVFEECDSLEQLCREIVGTLNDENVLFEVIFVDDGSRDGSESVLARLEAAVPQVRVITFRRNFGKSAALSAGFAAASGDIVITMDADLQDDPREIPRFLEALDAGADVVTGWKQIRHDPVDKTWPSRFFNAAVNYSFGLKLHDHNCGFKAYRMEALAELNLYGELHRFIPPLLHARGFRIVELPVVHHPRKFGKSKFGTNRIVKGALDLLTVSLTTRYGARPLHLFGGAGLIFGVLGFAVLSYLSLLWAFGMGPIGERPLLMLGMLLVLFGSQLVGTGLLGELLLARTIREQDKYSILPNPHQVKTKHTERLLKKGLAPAQPARSASTVSPASLTSAKPPSTMITRGSAPSRS